MPTERAGRVLTFDMGSVFTCRPFRIVRVAHHALWQAFRAGRCAKLVGAACQCHSKLQGGQAGTAHKIKSMVG
jgi:hypothetical protein